MSLDRIGQDTIVSDVELTHIKTLEDLPAGLHRDDLASFFHHKMKPYNDTQQDVNRALDYVFVPGAGQGGFAVVATRQQRLLGALLMLRTGMSGYIPSNILLFVAVDPELRGKGVGRRIIDLALSRCEGDVKLHVEHDNPARRLYERVGFESKYLEMRITRT